MTKRQIVKEVLNGKTPAYVPWNIEFTKEAREKIEKHYNTSNLSDVLDNHFNIFQNSAPWIELGNNKVKDPFGVIWDKSIDKDIGVVCNCLLCEPTIKNYTFPDYSDDLYFSHIPAKINLNPNTFRVFSIGFSLYERAWTLRGMENLMTDFCMYPDFTHKLLERIGDYNIALVQKALEFDIDAVLFGDDWGTQRGLQMGLPIWQEFIKPVLKRMYSEVRNAGKSVLIHSCGKVDELFDDLFEIGLNCFNPFQPEVMDTSYLIKKFHGKISFYGGLSTQKTLPYGSVDDVRKETRRLIDLGSNGNYIFAPAHAIDDDVPVENMVAFIEELQNQNGFIG